jgi:uncharacterized membrane protein YcaP (DUF421 family)
LNDTSGLGRKTISQLKILAFMILILLASGNALVPDAVAA